ncbi:MAG: hypothetical protein ACR2PZ_05540 [Pseudomonadales bacterium]
MSWILIAGLVLLAAFGPILWLKPSAKDKRLTALRERARNKNLMVDIKPLVLLNPSAEQRVSSSGARRDPAELLAVYSLILPKRLQQISGFTLHRAPAENARPISRGAVPVEPGWFFDPEQTYPPASAWPQSWEKLQILAEQLPQDVLALVVEPRKLGVYWSESAGSDVTAVDHIATTLELMGRALADLEAQLTAQSRDNDS